MITWYYLIIIRVVCGQGWVGLLFLFLLMMVKFYFSNYFKIWKKNWEKLFKKAASVNLRKMGKLILECFITFRCHNSQ